MWKPIKSRYKNGVLAKYMLLARSASEGAVTIPQLK
jgi:dihydroxy-acid dehydratase